MKVSEERLTIWSKPLSETEDDKCINAREQITRVIQNKFGNDVRVFLQGSYANNTNVRQDSDVDIVVMHKNHFFPDVTTLLQPHEQQTYWLTFVPANYLFSQFKNDVHSVLAQAFPGSIELKEKCFKVNGNTSRMNADVVAGYEHHLMSSPYTIGHKGISFITQSNTQINSFPEQHHVNGKEKNENTGRAYKQIVRILKNIRIDLLEAGVIEAEPMKSFFVECLVWNVPNEYFNGATYREVARQVISKIWNDMRNPQIASSYLEASNLSLLFNGSHRTPGQAEAFMVKAYNYLEP